MEMELIKGKVYYGEESNAAPQQMALTTKVSVFVFGMDLDTLHHLFKSI